MNEQVSNSYKLEQSSKTEQFKRFVTKKDIVIPAGTVLECVDGNKREFVNGMYEKIIGLTNDTSGYFTYGIEEGTDGINEWFEEVKSV